MLIIAITGMPGAGKTTVAKGLSTDGLKTVAMGDMIREETKRRNLYPNDQNMGTVMREMRERYGAGAVAELCMQSIKSMNADRVVVDGIRSMSEVAIFRRAGDVKLLAIWASPKRRFELLKARGRTDDPLTIESFNTRDERELSIGIGGAIALADQVLSNETTTIEELTADARQLVSRWMEHEH